MKHWTQRQALTGVSVSPDSINDELRAQQSSITTLDRTLRNREATLHQLAALPTDGTVRFEGAAEVYRTLYQAAQVNGWIMPE